MAERQFDEPVKVLSQIEASFQSAIEAARQSIDGLRHSTEYDDLPIRNAIDRRLEIVEQSVERLLSTARMGIRSDMSFNEDKK